MIISIGDLCVDNYIITGEKFVGGIAANFAVHAHRLGENVSLISGIGNDEHGKFALNELNKEGVNTELVQHFHGHTAEQKIRLENNERNFCGFNTGVLPQIRLTEEDKKNIANARAVVIPLSDGLEPVFKDVIKLEVENVLKVVDFSRDADIDGFKHGDVTSMLEAYIEDIDIAFLGADEETVDEVKKIASQHPNTLLVVTLGSKGSMALFKHKEYTQSAIRVEEVVDTTGCGDAFRAGFVTSYIDKNAIPEALQAGTEIAATVASHFGAF